MHLSYVSLAVCLAVSETLDSCEQKQYSNHFISSHLLKHGKCLPPDNSKINEDDEYLCKAANVYDDFMNGKKMEGKPTSVWCHTSENDLRCHFHNLYFNTVQREFVFFITSESIIYGIDSVKSLEKLYMSSVNGHNAFQIEISLLPLNKANIEGSNIITIQENTLFLGRFKPDNILHVFHDDLLPLYFTIREICFDAMLCRDSLNIIFTDRGERGNFWNLYQMFSKKVRMLEELTVSENVWYCFEEAYAGVNKMSVWYQYGFGAPQGPVVNKKFHGGHLKQFTSFCRSNLDVKVAPKILKGVLISRKSNRKILNENEISSVIQNLIASQENYDGFLMKILSLEYDKLENIISEVSSAKILIGVHGSALILGMFLPPGAMLVEIWPYGINPSAASIYRTMCELKSVHLLYIPWTNEDSSNTVYHPEYPQHYGGLGHLQSKMRETVISDLYAKKLNRLECCDGSEWLFRIYQDTKVALYRDVNLASISFIELVSDGLKKSEIMRPTNLVGYKYPGKLKVLKCHLEKEIGFTKLYIEWQEPWSVKYLDCEDVKYEIIIQCSGEEEFSDYVTHKPIFLKKLRSNVNIVNVWVACFCDGIEGPSSYMHCY